MLNIKKLQCSWTWKSLGTKVGRWDCQYFEPSDKSPDCFILKGQQQQTFQKICFHVFVPIVISLLFVCFKVLCSTGGHGMLGYNTVFPDTEECLYICGETFSYLLKISYLCIWVSKTDVQFRALSHQPSLCSGSLWSYLQGRSGVIFLWLSP